MRLWTIQNRSVLSAVEKGVWYSNFGYRNKDVDTDVDLALRGRYPIYTYAMLNQNYLNIDTLRCSIKEILHQHRLPRSWDDVLVELEVNEEDIIHIKPQDSMDYNSGFQFLGDYKNSLTDIIIGCKKGESPFAYPRVFEAVLHRIKADEIVAVHEFKVDTVNDTITLGTVYKNDAIGAPALSRYITVSTDAQFHIDRHKDSDLSQIKNSYKDINTLVREKCSATKPSPDMTIFEAVNFVMDSARIAIFEAFDEYESKKPSANMYNTRISDIM